MFRRVLGNAPHLLAAMITGARAVIAQKDVDAKANEIAQVRPLLAGVPIDGALVTAGALHVQRDTARYLVEEKKADYLFTAVKDNQAALFDALDALGWEDAPLAHVAEGKGHGRHERRTIQVLPAPGGCFPHAAQAVLVERHVRDPHDGRLRSSVAALGITNRTSGRRRPRPRRPRPLGPRGPAPRDVTMREDASWLRSGTSPPVAAILRNTAIAALRLAGFTSTAAGRRGAARNPARPLALMNLI